MGWVGLPVRNQGGRLGRLQSPRPPPQASQATGVTIKTKHEPCEQQEPRELHRFSRPTQIS